MIMYNKRVHKGKRHVSTEIMYCKSVPTSARPNCTNTYVNID